MNPEAGKSIAGFSIGVWIWIALMLVYSYAVVKIPPRVETGVRVIPWQAPDLEIEAPISPSSESDSGKNH